MRGMARCAIPFLDRLMLCKGLVQPRQNISVATAAHREHRAFEKAFLRRCVRVVAAYAPCFACHRPVKTVLRKHFIDRGNMAALALVDPQFLCPEGILRVRGIVAQVALFVRYRLVDGLIQNRSPVGTMRIMTGRALGTCDGIIAVPCSERGFVRPVALEAKGFFFSLQQMRSFRRRMGRMAFRTAFLDRVVFESHLRKGIGHLLVAAEAEFIAGFQKIEFIV